MSSTARPVEPTAPELATGRAYDDAQVKKTDQALGAWRAAFERHHEEQLALEAERLANKPALAPWFLAGASGLALLVAMVAVVARVVAPPSTVTAVSIPPIVETPVVEAAVEPTSVVAPPVVAPPVAAPPVVEATPPVAAAPAVQAPPPLAAASALEVRDARTWDADGHRWVSFDARTGQALTLSWLDATGRSVLDERTCGFPVGDGLRRCVVGRSQGRIGAALAAGAAPGAWRIEACAGAACAEVGTLEVAP
jgi:hypothetical protein